MWLDYFIKPWKSPYLWKTTRMTHGKQEVVFCSWLTFRTVQIFRFMWRVVSNHQCPLQVLVPNGIVHWWGGHCWVAKKHHPWKGLNVHKRRLFCNDSVFFSCVLPVWVCLSGPITEFQRRGWRIVRIIGGLVISCIVNALMWGWPFFLGLITVDVTFPLI